MVYIILFITFICYLVQDGIVFRRQRKYLYSRWLFYKNKLLTNGS